MSIYLRLSHGRRSPRTQMDEMGTDGPLIGPLSWLHATYTSTIRVGLPNGDVGWIEIVGDCLRYGRTYYGDWTILGPSQLPADHAPEPFSATLAGTGPQKRRSRPAKRGKPSRSRGGRGTPTR